MNSWPAFFCSAFSLVYLFADLLSLFCHKALVCFFWTLKTRFLGCGFFCSKSGIHEATRKPRDRPPPRCCSSVPKSTSSMPLLPTVRKLSVFTVGEFCSGSSVLIWERANSYSVILEKIQTESYFFKLKYSLIKTYFRTFICFSSCPIFFPISFLNLVTFEAHWDSTWGPYHENPRPPEFFLWVSLLGALRVGDFTPAGWAPAAPLSDFWKFGSCGPLGNMNSEAIICYPTALEMK